MATVEKSVGDLVYVDYDAFLADGKLFDTTKAESAKDAGFFDEKVEYGPLPVLLGSGKMFDAFEAAVAAAAVGKEEEVMIASDDAAGARDPRLVELHPLKEFYRQDITPYPGMEVQLGGRRGTVMSVGAGRVKVDFNSPLAGKDLIYRFIVREVVTDKIEKAKAAVKMSLGTSDGFDFTITKEKVTVILPELTKFDQTWPIARFRIVGDLRKIADTDTVEFIEVWSLGEKKEAQGSKPKKAKAPAKDDEPADEAERPKTVTAAKDDDEPKAPAKKAPAKKKTE
ncbi:MAG: FKBP-type peptidyl-prolyl cis-trans isomerase [Methanomassiliicoccaceae archaeon]|nr:FKBP-type peptidyl-prolyl cis-trans isomerase [Methanomassiliicoccaceae archaeon]